MRALQLNNSFLDNMKQLLRSNQLILMEAAIVEQLRRFTDIQLHDTLVNAPLIYHKEGQRTLNRLYQGYIDIARKADVPFLMCTPTWRANHSRVIDSGVSPSINSDAVQFMKNISSISGNSESTIKIGGLIGCKNDCYMPGEGLSITESEDFHSWQINQLAEGDVDFLIAETLPNVEEAIGIAKAMERTGLPYIISFVIDRQGAVLDGTLLSDAVKRIDAVTGDNPVAYMVNCAYPTFLNADRQPEELFSRLLGYLANASSLDHCDLDGSDNLESEKVSEWGDAMRVLNRTYGISILGGCCGTGPAHLRYLVDH